MTTQSNATQHATLISQANMDSSQLLGSLDSNRTGLASATVLAHRRSYGSNDIATEHVTPFGFVPLPLNYWLALFGMMLLYIPLTQYVKSWYVSRYGV